MVVVLCAITSVCLHAFFDTRCPGTTASAARGDHRSYTAAVLLRKGCAVTGRLVAPVGSPILEMARCAAEYRAQGRRIVDLTLGEPDFAPPGHVIAAGREAAARVLGLTGLPPSTVTKALNGARALRESLCRIPAARTLAVRRGFPTPAAPGNPALPGGSGIIVRGNPSDHHPGASGRPRWARRLSDGGFPRPHCLVRVASRD